MKVLIPLFTAILSSSAFAITPVNLLTLKNSPFSKIPVYNQGPVGNCYAFSAASLIDYDRIMSGEKISSPDDLSSTFWISTVYKKNDIGTWFKRNTGWGYEEDTPLDGGTAGSAISSVQKFGLCTRSMMNSALKKNFPELLNSNVNIDTFIGLLQNIDTEWKKIYIKAFSALKSNQLLAELEEGYKFPLQIPSDSQRPEYKEPVVAPVATTAKSPATPTTTTASANTIKFTLDVYQEPMRSDNTRVNRIYVPMLPPKVGENPKTPVYAPIDVTKIKNVVAIDNTYVAKRYDVDVHLFRLAADYATKTVENSLMKNHKLMPNFIDSLLKKLRKDDGYWDLAKSLYKSCSEEKKTISKKAVLTYRPFTTSDFVMVAHGVLSQGKPFAISYCSKMLETGKAHTYNSKECGNHSSVVVAIKDPAAPKILIQNSWGKSCYSVSKKWECLQDQGAIWVDAGILEKSLSKMVWINR